MIGLIPGSPATVSFTGPNGSHSITLSEESVKVRLAGQSNTRIPSQTDQVYKGMKADGQFTLGGITRRDLAWLSGVIAENVTIAWTNGRTVNMQGVILMQGDQLPELDYTEGTTETLTFGYSTYSEVN